MRTMIYHWNEDDTAELFLEDEYLPVDELAIEKALEEISTLLDSLIPGLPAGRQTPVEFQRFRVIG